MTKATSRRIVVLFATMAVAFAGIVVRLTALQVQDRQRFVTLAYDQRVHTTVLAAHRGDILDRNGVPLAITMNASDIYANPQNVTDPVGEAERIAPILGVRPKDIWRPIEAGGTFVYIARQVDSGVVQQIRALQLPGIGFLSVPKRYYPAGSLASQVLGFVGVDGTGLAGLEAGYQAELAGTPGKRTAELDPAGQPIAPGVDTVTPPVDGKNLETTIDRQIQFQAQQALANAVRANGAKAGTIIVMDPTNGDVYAMATYPWFDPNRYADANPDRWRNRAVTDAFEPGSVNKIITAAAAIERKSVSLSQRFQVPDQIKVGTYTIHDADPHPVQTMTLGDIIAESSNIGITKVANAVGEQGLAMYLARFGFGQTTGLGFPGESAGIVPSLPDWSDTSLDTISYGQGISVTPLQMASVYATIANDGVWVQPRLVRGTVGSDGVFRPALPSPTRRVISTSTAESLTQMLAYVVQGGTGVNAQIQGYQVAGKTGTALIPNPKGGYYSDRYIASFIGFLPAARPRVVVAAIIDRPGTVYGGVAAAPLFQQIARFAIQRLGIPSADPVSLPPHALRLP